MMARSLAVRALHAGSAAAAAAIARRVSAAPCSEWIPVFQCRGICHIQGGAVVRGAPNRVDEAQLAQQCRIFKLNGQYASTDVAMEEFQTAFQRQLCARRFETRSVGAI